jgi:hypothetical protein
MAILMQDSGFMRLANGRRKTLDSGKTKKSKCSERRSRKEGGLRPDPIPKRSGENTRNEKR